MKFPVNSLVLGLAVGLSVAPLSANAAEKAVLTAPVAATQKVSFDVYVPIQKRAQLETDLQAMHDPNSATYHRWLTPAESHAKYGATDAQIKSIIDELKGMGLDATAVNGVRIHVTGAAAAVEKALNAQLMNGVFKSGKTTVAAVHGTTPTSAMAKIGSRSWGFSNAIRMQTHTVLKQKIDNRYSSTGGYWFDDLKQAYQFPSYKTLSGKGTTIATLVDGAYSPDDMKLYFGHENLAVPKITEINVDGGAPFNDDSFETNLDLQQAGGMAPNAHLLHYNIPDLSDNSIIDGLIQIITDNTADVVSMSFGGPELEYTAEYNDGYDLSFLLEIEDEVMAIGNTQGITFGASSGDYGALTLPPVACFEGYAPCGMMRASVNFPASSPHASGVGGTNLKTAYDGSTRNSAYVKEEAFGDPLIEDALYGTAATGEYWGSGGGDSILFSKPQFQNYVDTGNKKMRTVPDLAFHMGGCPGGGFAICNSDDSYDLEVFNGGLYGVIGTSAGAPDLAGLAALGMERNFGVRLGNVNYLLYTLAYLQTAGAPIKPFKKGIAGYNGLYFTSAKPYNRVIGLGSVNGTEILLAPKDPVAGIPLTASNP